MTVRRSAALLSGLALLACGGGGDSGVGPIAQTPVAAADLTGTYRIAFTAFGSPYNGGKVCSSVTAHLSGGAGTYTRDQTSDSGCPASGSITATTSGSADMLVMSLEGTTLSGTVGPIAFLELHGTPARAGANRRGGHCEKASPSGNNICEGGTAEFTRQ